MRLFILHRYRVLAEALEVSLRRQGATVVGFADELRSALEQLSAVPADVLLLDAQLGCGGLRPAIRQLRAAAPAVKVLVLGLDDGVEIGECLAAGASSCLPGRAALGDLIGTLRAVHEGAAPGASAGAHLTPREQEVLRLVIAGRRNQEIADQLFIALPTVKIHVHKILKKLRVHNRREAARLALESGLFSEQS